MRLILIVIGVLDAAALGVASNVAATNLPSIINRRQDLAWPVFGLLTILEMALALWNYHASSRERPPALPTFSTENPLIVELVQRTEREAEKREKENRVRMIQRVRTFWIDGVLEESLYHIARMELELEARPAAVARPWDLIIQKSGRPEHPLPAGKSISEQFDDMGQAILILGDPGSGKTTLLLELAKELLDRAEEDSSYPIPVVFNLSSWAIARSSLIEWMVEELQERYVVPRAIGRSWVQSQQIAPLLDGLDEVVQEHRRRCIDAINEFRMDYGLLPIAVCSRIADYEGLRSSGGVSAELVLEQAIFIKSLTHAQVDSYLREAGEPLSGVRSALRADRTLWELLNTPLLLSVMALTYGNRSAAEVRKLGPRQERRTRLFIAYTDAMFDRRGRSSRFDKGQAVKWLRWLARTLTINRQTLLRLEWMQPGWLPRKWQRRVCTVGASILLGVGATLLVGVAGWLLYRPIVPHGLDLLNALEFGIISGVVCGLASYSQTIRPAEGLDWSWPTLRDSLIAGVLNGIEYGTIYGLVLAIVAILVGSTFGLPGLGASLGSALSGAIVSLLIVLALGINIGLTVGVLRWTTIQRTAIEIVPREDAPGMTRNVWLAGFACTLHSALIYGGTLAFVGAVFGKEDLGFRAGILLGLTLGLVLTLRIGGEAFGQHLALRAVMAWRGYAPWRYSEFLDNATERLFLRKVGRGYIFVHRLLLEHFANQAEHGG